MNASLGWLPMVLVLGGALSMGCSDGDSDAVSGEDDPKQSAAGADSGDNSDSGGGDTGGANSGGADNGGADNGGADNGGADNGGADNGGADNGGADNGGADNGGLPDGACRDQPDCGVGASCYRPDASGPNTCGAPEWCGQCVCPDLTDLVGAGQSCDVDNPCPTAQDNPDQQVASFCDPSNGSCGGCVTNADCGSDTPVCAIDAFMFSLACFECETTADCEIGVCTERRVCQSVCTSDERCGPNQVCSEQERCVPQPCETDSDCAEASDCVEQLCQPRQCQSDAECAGGYCVQGACFEQPGRCQFDMTP